MAENKRVFICSPYRGATAEEQEQNVARARAFLAHAVRLGRAPFAPHLLYPGVLNDALEHERNQGIAAGLNFLLTCGDIWWLDTPKGVTSGMRKELELADVAGLSIRRAELFELFAVDGVPYYDFQLDLGQIDTTWRSR